MSMDGYTFIAILVGLLTLEECVRAVASAWAKRGRGSK